MRIIKGAGELPEHIQSVTPLMMHPMPLHNYDDLPASLIAPWCLWFQNQSSDAKTSCFERIWLALSTEDQTAVIKDLKIFVTNGIRLRDMNEASEEDTKTDTDISDDVDNISLTDSSD